MTRPNRPKSLFRIIAERVIALSLAAMAIQLVIVFAEYYRDTPELARLMVEREVNVVISGSSRINGSTSFLLPEDANRYREPGSGYFARIRQTDGTVLFSSCTDACEAHFLPLAWNPPDFWMRQIMPGKPVNVAGGRTMTVDGRRVLVEIAIIGDRQGRMWSVIAHELADHMVLPMSLMLVLVLGGILISVRRSLRPVATAATMAHNLDLQSPGNRLRSDGMPSEIADLVHAINVTHERIAALIEAQKVFTSAIGHELRTPLAAMKLDIGKIADVRARRAEAEIDRLSRFVTQLTALARLEISEMGERTEIDIESLCKSRVVALADWVYRNHHTIEFRSASASKVNGDEALIENAIGNLIENAVRHTPPGTHIIVQAGPGPSLSVTDDAGLAPSISKSATHLPQEQEKPMMAGLGLRIVSKIAALHGATFEMQRIIRSTVARLDFSGDKPSAKNALPGRIRS